MKKLILIAASASLLVVPAVASAQLGGLAGKLTGGSSADSNASAPDMAQFIANSTQSTKNVMISSALLAQALTNRGDLAAKKAEIEAINKAHSPAELAAHKDEMASNLATLSGRANLSDDLTATYNQASAAQKAVIGQAVANLALGIYRNTQLVGQAQSVMAGVRSNPLALSHVGDLKTLTGLLGMQAKGIGTVGTSLPKLMKSIKVTPPVLAETTKPKSIDLAGI